MVHSCCAYGCKNRFVKGSGIAFYRFPRNAERRNLWILAIKRENWAPLEETRICGQHFHFGRPSSEPTHPDYIPSIFSFNKIDAQKGRSKLNRFLQRTVHSRIIAKKRTAHMRVITALENSTGKPAELRDIEDPDWVPSVKMGYIDETSADCLYKTPQEKAESVDHWNENGESGSKKKRLLINKEASIIDSRAVNFQDKLRTITDGSFQNSGSVSSENRSRIYSRTNKENTNINLMSLQSLSFMKEGFSFKILLRNLSLIIKPNSLWGISPHLKFIVCARWCEDYTCERKVVIENSLNVRAFLKDWEINLSNLMKITCIDDVSKLLEKVEQYKIP